MSDGFMRRTLLTSAVCNAGAAILFAFPESLGGLAGLPAPAPHVYTASLAVLVALFGGAYAWLARQPAIDRPLVALSALGKTGFVAVVVGCWLAGELPALAVATASADLVFAGLFAWWLVAVAPAPAAAVRAASG